MNQDLEQTEKNKGGRPVGSKNQITILKMALEHATRAENVDQIKRILKGILDDAEQGDRHCRKMVWESVMSKSGTDNAPTAGARPEIIIRTEGSPPPVKRVEVIEGEIEEISNG